MAALRSPLSNEGAGVAVGATPDASSCLQSPASHFGDGSPNKHTRMRTVDFSASEPNWANVKLKANAINQYKSAYG